MRTCLPRGFATCVWGLQSGPHPHHGQRRRQGGNCRREHSSSSNLITLIRNSNPTEQFNHDLTLIVKAYVKNKLLRTAFHSLAGIAEEII